ncbi:hypothetical protein [Streptomyces sp. NPDC023588]|uniref:hypothetical protein n=1 Tax=Streptomyces sp. NPDC023588 TaxID=3154907 RepID=UPI0033E3E419
MDTTRCTAAHDEDPTSCIGPQDAVTIVDKLGTAVPACENHGATLLASLYDGRVEPGTVLGAATRVFAAADTTHPFPWLVDALRTEPGQLSNAANRAAEDAGHAGDDAEDSYSYPWSEDYDHLAPYDAPASEPDNR